MRTRSLLLLLPLLFLAACDGGKYPFPPQFVSIENVGLNALPTPPTTTSLRYQREMEGILARQARLSDTEKLAIADEDSIKPEMIVQPVLGKTYMREQYPALYLLLAHAASDAWQIADATQDHWQRKRPWLVDARVQLLVRPITRPGYPSGHATTNSVWAHVLSELFPHKREALFARASAIGNHRIDGGAHFPHDVEAGKKLATTIYQKMRMHPEYQRELAAARAEVMAAKRDRVAADTARVPRDATLH